MIVYDEFLGDPDAAIADAHGSGFRDVEYSDGVTYPDLSPGEDEEIRRAVISGIQQLCGFDIDVNEYFYRSRRKGVGVPHWAHVDCEISEYTAVLYLADPDEGVKAGTAILEHVNGWRGAPDTDERLDEWKKDTNDESKWNIVEFADMKKNRMVIFRADELHAAFPKEGLGEDHNGRLILVVFFSEKKEYIRMATPADGPELTELFVEFAHEKEFDSIGISTNPMGWMAEITNEIANNLMFGCFVAVVDGQVVGAVASSVGTSWLDRRQTIAYEKFWYMTPKYRKTKLGLKLFNAIEEWAEAVGASAVNFIALSTSDDSVRKLYAKRGYIETETHFMKAL